MVTSGEMKLREAASLGSRGPVTVGSYYRTVGQARKNIRESLVTVLIGLWLGVANADDVRRLFELVGAGAREFSADEQDRFLAVLEALLDRILL